jgi:hypothetical protein
MNHLKSVVFLSLLVAVLFGCDKEKENSEPTTILTVQVDAGYKVTWDSWVIVSDLNGELLDAKPYTSGQTVTFSTVKAVDKMNITFFEWSLEREIHGSFNTYTGIPKGTTLHFAAPLPKETMTLSDATFKIKNYDPSTNIVFSNGYSYGARNFTGDNELDVYLNFFGAPSNILMSSYRGGVPVYNLAKGVVDGDVFELDFATDFVPVPHQFTLDYEGKNSGWVWGVDATRKQYTEIITTLRLAGKPGDSDHPLLGYVDGFDAYHMSVSNSNASGQVYYSKLGTFNSSPVISSFTFSLEKSDLRDLSFNFSEDYSYYYATWSDTRNATWAIFGPEGVKVQNLSVLPPELATKYPNIDLSKLAFSSISFAKIVEGKTYLEMLPGAVPGDPYTFEYYFYTPKL